MPKYIDLYTWRRKKIGTKKQEKLSENLIKEFNFGVTFLRRPTYIHHDDSLCVKHSKHTLNLEYPSLAAYCEITAQTSC